ncbi:MAG: helix-hairpin-helix domain-containing protein [Lentisphaeria bacterium]|nr:helix-hairpin-helix domain-containing protein [Lentisphaeria bacterium]NQZ69993.1 helix-hairpin-helix domain-containing protein [Lentisphaeria bacterium]
MSETKTTPEEAISPKSRKPFSLGFLFILAFFIGLAWTLLKEEPPVNTRVKKNMSLPIDVNTANRAELQKVPGIGPGIARNIIVYRKSNGEFKNWNELQKVKGLGPKKIKRIKKFLKIKNFSSEKSIININTATVDELQTLTGIGRGIAQKISDYRTANGAFKQIEDLKNVKGMSAKKYDKIQNEIDVK